MIKKKTVTKKKATRKKSTKKEKPDDIKLEILQTSKCKTVSGKSTLTYHVGIDSEDNIFIRVNGNTGGGYFSKEWVAVYSITSVLDNAPADSTITSINLIPLFKGKSVNTPGYLLAALVSEGLLSANQEKKRHYVYSGADKFLSKVNKRKSVR